MKNVQEDEIVRLYCCKSIENITAQAKDVGTKFAQVDTLMTLLTCFNSSRNEGFRTSICCSFHHIIQLNSSLRETLLEKMGIQNLI
jgi:serine/threonine-protein kinase ULK4